MALFHYIPIPTGGARSLTQYYTQSANALVEPRITYDYLRGFADEGYRVIQPIPVRFERDKSGYIASFEEADIAISGDSKFDAGTALADEIICAFEDWLAHESDLGAGPAQQLAVLRRFVAKA